jgi:predicted anti-sigma-YlaC factor YlaD
MRSAVDDRSCTRARLVLSVALDGEAAASEDVLAAARHLCSCRRCGRFAAEVTAFTQELRIGRLEPSGFRRDIEHSTEGGRS